MQYRRKSFLAKSRGAPWQERALKLQLEEHRLRESESKKDKRSLKLELKELELAHEDAIRELKQENDKNVTKLRQQYEREGTHSASPIDLPDGGDTELTRFEICVAQSRSYSPSMS